MSSARRRDLDWRLVCCLRSLKPVSGSLDLAAEGLRLVIVGEGACYAADALGGIRDGVGR